MNALPEEVRTFIKENPLIISFDPFTYDTYDRVDIGKKMGSLLLKYPNLEDDVVLKIIGNLYSGECRGLRISLLENDDGRKILEHILQIEPSWKRRIILRSYISYLQTRDTIETVLEDENIYLWKDQAIYFLSYLIKGDEYKSESDRDAQIRCAYQMAQRLGMIPGEDDYENMFQNITSFIQWFTLYSSTEDYVPAKFWAFYLIANPGIRSEETFQRLEKCNKPYILSHILANLKILDPHVLEEPVVANFNTAWGHFNEDDFEGYIV
jgi:hypothetical protein